VTRCDERQNLYDFVEKLGYLKTFLVDVLDLVLEGGSILSFAWLDAVGFIKLKILGVRPPLLLDFFSELLLLLFSPFSLLAVLEENE